MVRLKKIVHGNPSISHFVDIEWMQVIELFLDGYEDIQHYIMVLERLSLSLYKYVFGSHSIFPGA